MKPDKSKIDIIIDRIRTERNPRQLFIVTDKNDVALINQYVDAHNAEKERQENELKLAKQNSLGNRYKRGDKTVIPEIIKILKSADSSAITNLSIEMDTEYDATGKSVLYLDDSVKNVLFPLIENPELEYAVVNFIGYKRVSGYVGLFERRLLSGKSTQGSLIFKFLGHNGKSEKALDYFLDQKTEGNIFWSREGLISF